MANTEQIEAKLCAYVDGELDAAGRAEIEAHLATNPQHRQLLEELMRQRELLRDLPREKAPDDLSEALQAQLERSVLLGGQKTPASRKISYWPQFTALAAVLVLAVGLAAVIYLVLPNESKQLHNYAVIPTSAPSAAVARTSTTAELPATSPTTFASGAGSTLGAGESPSAVPGAKADVAAKVEPDSAPATTERMSKSSAVAVATPTPPVAMAQPAPNEKNADIFADQSNVSRSKEAAAKNQLIFGQPPIAPDIQAHVTNSPQIPSNSVVFVVASDNPTATNKEVTGYLGQNNIRWDDVTEPMPKHAELRKEMVYQSKLPYREVRLRDSTTVASKGSVIEPDIARNLDQIEQKPFVGQRAAPTTQPIADSLKKVESQVQPITSQPSQVAKQVPPSSSHYIVARNLTPQQVDALYGCLNAQNGGRIGNYTRNGSEITPTTLPAIALSQSAWAVQTRAMQEQEQMTQQIQQAAKALGGKSRAIDESEAHDKLTTQAASESATTQPTTNSTAIITSPTSAPAIVAAIPAQLTKPATQPATTAPALVHGLIAAAHPATTSATDQERLDVVIVVKPDQAQPTASPPPLPSTQPVATTAPAASQPAIAK